MILPIYPSSSQRSIYNHKSISPKLSPSRFSFIRSRLPDPSYDFKKSMNIRHSNCAVYTDLFYYNNGFHNFLRKVICFVTSSNTLQYCFNVVFLFYSFLVTTVYTVQYKYKEWDFRYDCTDVLLCFLIFTIPWKLVCFFFKLLSKPLDYFI